MIFPEQKFHGKTCKQWAISSKRRIKIEEKKNKKKKERRTKQEESAIKYVVNNILFFFLIRSYLRVHSPCQFFKVHIVNITIITLHYQW